jgi:hypothetical protein
LFFYFLKIYGVVGREEGEEEGRIVYRGDGG